MTLVPIKYSFLKNDFFFLRISLNPSLYFRLLTILFYHLQLHIFNTFSDLNNYFIFQIKNKMIEISDIANFTKSLRKNRNIISESDTKH